MWRDGSLSIEDLRFAFPADRVHRAAGGEDLTDTIEWATFGQRVLRGGTVARIDDLLDQFYDVRHPLAFDHHREEGERTRRALYEGIPRRSEEYARGPGRSSACRARDISTTRSE